MSADLVHLANAGSIDEGQNRHVDCIVTGFQRYPCLAQNPFNE